MAKKKPKDVSISLSDSVKCRTVKELEALGLKVQVSLPRSMGVEGFVQIAMQLGARAEIRMEPVDKKHSWAEIRMEPVDKKHS
jgi:hypothetical protein